MGVRCSKYFCLQMYTGGRSSIVKSQIYSIITILVYMKLTFFDRKHVKRGGVVVSFTPPVLYFSALTSKSNDSRINNWMKDYNYKYNVCCTSIRLALRFLIENKVQSPLSQLWSLTHTRNYECFIQNTKRYQETLTIRRSLWTKKWGKSSWWCTSLIFKKQGHLKPERLTLRKYVFQLPMGCCNKLLESRTANVQAIPEHLRTL